MASSYIMIRKEIRPCFVNGVKTLWHGWSEKSEIVPPSMLKGGHRGGVATCPLAIIEYEDGHVDAVFPWDVRFADSAGRFSEFCFGEEAQDNG